MRLYLILSLSNLCPASNGSPFLRSLSTFSNRRLERARVSGRIERRVTRFEPSIQHRSSWRGRETENVDSAMRTARNGGTKIAKSNREKWGRGGGRNTSARRSKNSPLLPLILLSFSVRSLLSILAESRPRTLCRKRRDEMEWGRGSGNLRLDDYRSIDSRIDRHPSG